MPSKIRILPDNTINQIAAGEVIENSASVVKELVENSIDAGATEITIEIKGGGRLLLRVTDNGCGMNADDALLCLERHATSKIKGTEEIFHISTMGFRGEAIPSIASISKFTLLTRESNGASSGTMVVIDGGNIVQCTSVACSVGTTVEVKSLFFNLPARKKFQKAPAHDIHEIVKAVSALALGHPRVRIQLISEQKTLLSSPGYEGEDFCHALQECITHLLGEQFLEEMRPIRYEDDCYALLGFIGTPEYTRHNRTGQYLFINKRAVLCPAINFAVRDGYSTSLPPQRHPVYVLHLTVPEELVDVNVHPQKREVRLRQEAILKGRLSQWIRKALTCRTTAFHPGQGQWQGNEDEGESPVPPASFSMPFPLQEYRPMADLPKTASPLLQKKNPFLESELTFSTAAAPKQRFPSVLAALKNYLIVDGDGANYGDGLWMVDQRRAHARIAYDQCLHRNKTIAIQTLLLPYPLAMTPIESSLLEEQLDLLNQMGIQIRQTGAHAFLVDAIPQILDGVDIVGLIRELLLSFQNSQGSSVSLQQERQKRIAQAASRSIMAKELQLSKEEGQRLLEQLMASSNPYHCPAGKPIFARFTFSEVEKKFCV